MAAEDEKFMRLALVEAQKGVGRVSPNPAVGAVLVERGRVVARGHHEGAGLPHAEINCLKAAGQRSLKRATLYVTLEPCSTSGRTPPCTEAIIRSGVQRVVIGTMDVNPRHAGHGAEALDRTGISVTCGVLADECAELNLAFNTWIVTGRPLVIAKCGMTLDGRLTRPPGERRWITGPAARRHAMELRARVDAILIGAETLRRDNPRLTIRGIWGAKQPWRVVLSRSGRLPPHAHLFTDRFAARTLVYKKQALDQVLFDLGRREITSVLIEGGGEVLGEAFDRHLVNRVQFYVAPLLSGGPVPAVGGTGAGKTAEGARLRRPQFLRLGRDVCITGEVKWQQELE